ncbi:MAG: hypothetical protein ACYTFW_26110 [Planctomycetota bacterium]|jgi:Holliday junction resolvase RusA-like endonuclease
MKSLSRTIIVLVFVSLVMTSFALGEKATEQEVMLTQVQQLNNPFLEILPAKPLTYQLDTERMQASIAKFVAAETVLVIPTPETIEKSPDFIETTVKDLNIMCHIFDKELKLSGHAGQVEDVYFMLRDTLDEHLINYPDFFSHGGRKTKGIYLDGYGVLFLIEVNFLLSAPPQVEENEKPTEGSLDPAWKQAELELYSPEKLKKKGKGTATIEYDPEKVEELKRKLVKTLKQAANIKSLKADESINISVKGRHSAANPTKVLIVRVNKSDLDGFAKGSLDFDKFRQKVQMLMY